MRDFIYHLEKFWKYFQWNRKKNDTRYLFLPKFMSTKFFSSSFLFKREFIIHSEWIFRKLRKKAIYFIFFHQSAHHKAFTIFSFVNYYFLSVAHYGFMTFKYKLKQKQEHVEYRLLFSLCYILFVHCVYKVNLCLNCSKHFLTSEFLNDYFIFEEKKWRMGFT